MKHVFQGSASFTRVFRSPSRFHISLLFRMIIFKTDPSKSVNDHLFSAFFSISKKIENTKSYYFYLFYFFFNGVEENRKIICYSYVVYIENITIKIYKIFFLYMYPHWGASEECSFHSLEHFHL